MFIDISHPNIFDKLKLFQILEQPPLKNAVLSNLWFADFCHQALTLKTQEAVFGHGVRANRVLEQPQLYGQMSRL
jgi:hypothetical protein